MDTDSENPQSLLNVHALLQKIWISVLTSRPDEVTIFGVAQNKYEFNQSTKLNLLMSHVKYHNLNN